MGNNTSSDKKIRKNKIRLAHKTGIIILLLLIIIYLLKFKLYYE